MARRIKYKERKDRENWMESHHVYVSEINGARYKVFLALDEMKYFIRNERTKEFTKKSKEYGNLNVLKRNARAALEKLGVNLGSKEIRDRQFGLCKKGYTQEKHEELQNK